MNAQTVMTNSLELPKRGLYRAGGIAAFVLVVGYFLTFPVYGLVGFYPEGTAERLAYFAERTMGWWILTGLMVSTDLLYIPVWLALYRAMQVTGKNVMLLASAFIGCFVVLDLAVTWTAHAALIAFGSEYANATNEAQRVMLTAAAGYPSAILDSPLLGIYAILLPSLGVLLTTYAMARARSGKYTVLLGWVVALTGIIAGLFSGALPMMPVVNALLAMVWFLFVGWNLFKLEPRG